MKAPTHTTIAGRPCTVRDLGHLRAKQGWSSFNMVAVSFTDTGEYHAMPAGAFVKWSERLEREAKRSRIEQ